MNLFCGLLILHLKFFSLSLFNVNCDNDVPTVLTDYTCSPGHYLDVESQQCVTCVEGTYSLGDGSRWDRFRTDQLPTGFSIKPKNVVDEIERIRKMMNEEEGDLMTTAHELLKIMPQEGGRSRRSLQSRSPRQRRDLFDEQDDTVSLDDVCAG